MIDAFSEWIGEKIVVEWRENEQEAKRFRVNERDDAIPEAEEGGPKPKLMLREWLAAEGHENRNAL